MSSDIGKESRSVGDFEQVKLRLENWLSDLDLVLGERESLTLEGSPDLLSKIQTTVKERTLELCLSVGFWEKLGYAVATSLTRPRVRLRLEVKSLTALSVFGAARVRVSKLQSDNLSLRFHGAGQIQIPQLSAETLAVDLGGASRIELAGRATEQKVTIFGAGIYDAGDLESRSATVHLKGMGRASVWVIEELTTDICGVGSVEVRGEPRVRRSVPVPWSLPAAP